MLLVDCFIELVAYVAYFIKTAPTQQTSFEQIKTDVTHLINKSQDNFHQSRQPQDDFDLARFAVFAWIDETILNSGWQEKGKWQGEQLQRTYYQTTDAGEIFYDKLNQLQPQQTQVREVYYLCLAMGFTGRYCNPGDEFLLDQLKNSNLKILGGTPDMRMLEEEQLFPDAYHRDKATKSSARGIQRSSLGLLFGAMAPVLLYGILFFIYRFVLDNVGKSFLASVQ